MFYDVSVNAGSLLGAGQCERGPDFWCASQENAELCSTVQYCQNEVWVKQHRQAALVCDYQIVK